MMNWKKEITVHAKSSRREQGSQSSLTDILNQLVVYGTGYPGHWSVSNSIPASGLFSLRTSSTTTGPAKNAPDSSGYPETKSPPSEVHWADKNSPWPWVEGLVSNRRRQSTDYTFSFKEGRHWGDTSASNFLNCRSLTGVSGGTEQNVVKVSKERKSIN